MFWTHALNLIAQQAAQAVPLPSSALMIMALVGGVAMFIRSPHHKRRRKRR